MNLYSGRASLVRAKSVAAAIIFVSLATGALAEEVKLETESYMIPSADRDIELYIRNKHPAGVTSFSADKILLFVHGATYPAETTFDLPLGGRSMMDYIAQQGWDVYLDDRFRESCHKRGIHLSFQAPICAGALRTKD